MKLSIQAMASAVQNKVKALRIARKTAGGVIPALFAMLMCNNAFATGEDLLKAGQETVTATFGADSSIAKWIILAEVIVGIITYIKTKNMFMLFGIAVVIVFTTIGFGLAG